MPDHLPGPLRVARPAFPRPPHRRGAAARARPRREARRAPDSGFVRRARARGPLARRAVPRALTRTSSPAASASASRSRRRSCSSRSCSSPTSRSRCSTCRSERASSTLLDDLRPLGPRHPHDHARPLDGRPLRRPHRGHVPRPHRRGRARRARSSATRSIRTRRRSSRSFRGATRAIARGPQILAGETPNPVDRSERLPLPSALPAAFDRCPTDDPVELLPAGATGHGAACWLLEQR